MAIDGAPSALLGGAPSARLPNPESISEAVLIAEAELASEAARPKPRWNRTSGLMFVLKTSLWRPGDLSSIFDESQPASAFITIKQSILCHGMAARKHLLP